MKCLFENGGYPLGTQYNPKAPWNQEYNEPKEIEVTVSVTISKTIKIEVEDYRKEEFIDEDGMPCVDYDFSDCDIRTAVKQQVHLPNDSKEFKDWTTDDFEVVLE